MEMGIFNVMAKAKEPSISLDFLVASTGADRLLMGEDLKSDLDVDVVLIQIPVRITRVLTAMKILIETAENSYCFSPSAKAFVDGSPIGDALKHLFAFISQP